MFFAPFNASRFPLDASQYFFGDFADCRAQRTKCFGRVPFKDGREIFRLEPMFFRQPATAEQHILNARRRRISECQFEVEFIISHQKRSVNDVAQLVLMLLPVVHDALHRDFFKLTCKPAIGRNAVFLFQHSGDGRSVFFANRPCKRRSGVLPSAGIRYVKNVAVAGHVAGHIQQRNAFCAAPDVPPHGVRPQLKRRAGGRVRALGVDHQLVVKAIFVYVRSRRQKSAPIFPIGGDLPHGLPGKLHIIFQFCHLIAPAFLSVPISFFFLGKPLFASYPQFINRFHRVFNMDVHNLSTFSPNKKTACFQTAFP